MFPFACKQNMNLRPIKQIRFSRREIRFSLRISFLKIMSNFVGKITPIRKLSAIYHTKISRTQHSRQRRRARPSVPSAAAPRPEADCGAAAACANGSGRRALLFILRFSNLSPLKARIFTLLSLLICARLRAAAHCKTTAPTRGLSCTPLQTRPRGTPRILLAWQRVCKRRSHNAAGKCGDGARESALDKPSRLLYTHTSK